MTQPLTTGTFVYFSVYFSVERGILEMNFISIESISARRLDAKPLAKYAFQILLLSLCGLFQMLTGPWRLQGPDLMKLAFDNSA